MLNHCMCSNKARLSVNLLTPMSDQDRISPYKINTNINHISDENKENINLGIISWSNTEFSELTLLEL